MATGIEIRFSQIKEGEDFADDDGDCKDCAGCDCGKKQSADPTTSNKKLLN